MCVGISLFPESRKLDVVQERPEFCDTHQRGSYQADGGIDYERRACPVSVTTGNDWSRVSSFRTANPP